MTTMKKTSLLFAALPVFALSALPAFAGEQAFDAKSLEIENVVGRVTITTGNVSQIKVDIDNGAGVMETPKASMSGDVLRVGYDHKQKVRQCSANGRYSFGDARNVKLRLKGGKKHNLAEYPSIHIVVPANTSLDMHGGAVFGTAGDMGASDVAINSCGDFRMGNVNGDFRANINGSGDLAAGNVAGALDTSINGSGDVRIGAVSGDARLAINGSGDIDTGVVQGLSTKINGSGDVKVASATGAVSITINGSGDVGVKDGEATPLSVTVRGSGDIKFGGHANGVDYNLAGSGDIDVRSFSGDLNRRGPKADISIKDGHLHVGN